MSKASNLLRRIKQNWQTYGAHRRCKKSGKHARSTKVYQPNYGKHQ